MKTIVKINIEYRSSCLTYYFISFFPEVCIMLLELLKNIFFFSLHVENGTVFPKPLSKKEEEECFIQMNDGDKSAKNKLIEHNLRLVAHIVKKYSSSISEQDELISIGTIGLIKAVSTFDYSKGARFATYASRCIENKIVSIRLLKFQKKQNESLFQIHGKFVGKSAIISIFYIVFSVTKWFMLRCIFTLSYFLLIDT